MQGSLVVLVTSIHIYPTIKKDFSNFCKSEFGCEMQWSVVIVVPCIRICAQLEKEHNNLQRVYLAF